MLLGPSFFFIRGGGVGPEIVAVGPLAGPTRPRRWGGGTDLVHTANMLVDTPDAHGESFALLSFLWASWIS